MIHPLAIHAFALIHGRRITVWRSDAWLNRGLGHHLSITRPSATHQLSLFGAPA